MRLVVVVGRHWPLLSNLGRPRDGPIHIRKSALPAARSSGDGPASACRLASCPPSQLSGDMGLVESGCRGFARLVMNAVIGSIACPPCGPSI